jgi:uncharacterized protein
MGENAEIVRRGYAALAEGGVEALMPLVPEDFEFSTPPALAAEPDTYRGHDGLRRYFDSFYEAMDEVSFEPLEFREAGDRVVVPFRLTARGRSTGLEFDQEAVAVWQVRDGLAAGLEVFPTLDEALAAVKEQDA